VNNARTATNQARRAVLSLQQRCHFPMGLAGSEQIVVSRKRTTCNDDADEIFLKISFASNRITDWPAQFIRKIGRRLLKWVKSEINCQPTKDLHL
jgi:hypothetical protein